MTIRWKPSVTVAAIIEHEGRYLLVEEQTPEGLRLNNPAGHLDPGESPLQGCAREALEETPRLFTPTELVGVYLSRQINPYQFGRGEQPGGFFQGFTGTPLQGGLPRVQMPRRIVQAQALWRLFFNQQIAALMLNDGGHRHTGFPTNCHGLILAVFKALWRR